jgi:hypothetical protein
MCSHCLGHVEPRGGVTRDAPPSGWREARYPGQCAICGEPYTTGTHIAYDPTSGRWIAECCALEDDGGDW